MRIPAPYNNQFGIFTKKCEYVKNVYVGSAECRQCKHFKGYYEKMRSVDVICWYHIADAGEMAEKGV